MNNKALNIGFIGAGQGGGNIVNVFAKKGYQVMALNTAQPDLDKLVDIPAENKMLVRCGNMDGAGADPAVGFQALMDHGEEVISQIESIFTEDIDIIYVCAGLGRGTGSGISPAVLQLLIANESQRSEEGKKERAIGAIVTYPASNEAPKVKIIANKAFSEISGIEGLASLLVIDNNKADGGIGLKNRYDNINGRLVGEITSVNRLAAEPTEVALDARDLYTALSTRGNIAFFTIEMENTGVDMEMNILQKLEYSYRNSVNLETDIDKAYGCQFFFEVPKNAKSLVTESLITKMKNVLGNPFEDYYGIYEKDGRNNPKMKIHVILYGLPYPEKRIKEDEEKIAQNAQKYQGMQQNTKTQAYKGAGNDLFDQLISGKNNSVSEKPINRGGAQNLLAQMKQNSKKNY